MKIFYKLIKTTRQKETEKNICSCTTLDEAQFELGRYIFLIAPISSNSNYTNDSPQIDQEFWTQERIISEIKNIFKIIKTEKTALIRNIFGDDVLVNENCAYYEDYSIKIVAEPGTCDPFNPEMSYPAVTYDYVNSTSSVSLVEGKNLQCLTYYASFNMMEEDFRQKVIGFVEERQRSALAYGTVWTNYEKTIYAVFYIPQDPNNKFSVMVNPVFALIKVRGQLQEDKTWITGNLVSFGLHYCIISNHDTKEKGSRHSVYTKTVGIFTGIYDIRNQPIYTDDVVEITCPSDKEYLMNFGGKIVHRVSPIPEFGCYGFTQDRTESELREEYDKIFGDNPQEFKCYIPFQEYYEIEKKFVWSLRELLAPKSDKPYLEIRVIGNLFDNPELLDQETIFFKR